MTARLTLICHGSTDAVRAAGFPADEPLDHHGETGAAELAGTLPKVDSCWTSPELRTRQTAEAFGLSADIQPMLRECDYGRWAGNKFGEIVADEPDAPIPGCTIPRPRRTAASPLLPSYGGCDMARGRGGARQRSIAITHSTIIRAAIVHVIEAAPQSFWRIDIAPLSVTRLSCQGRRWNLSAAGCLAT